MLPLLLVLALALVQVGLLARDQLIVVQAARAGAREAAVQADEAAIRAVALSAGTGLDADGVTISIMRKGSVGDPVTVEIGYTESIRVPFVGWLFGDAVNFRASATDRQEFAP